MPAHGLSPLAFAPCIPAVGARSCKFASASNRPAVAVNLSNAQHATRRRRRAGAAMVSARVTEPSSTSAPSPLDSEVASDAADALIVRRVASYCVADEIHTPALYRRLLRDPAKPPGCVLSSMGSNALHISLPTCHAYVFGYGCIVVWGSRVEDETEILALVAQDAVVPRRVPVVETLEWTQGTCGGIAADVVTLEFESENERAVLEKLAISFALSQSIKLQAFEIAIRDTIDRTRYLPEEMARRGRISARRSEIAAALGALFLHRYAFNLNGDVVNTPQFFWENDEYLATYRRAERYMELGQRTARHNAQLNALQDLLELLATSENNRHASELELAILLLIAIEIALTITNMAKQGISVLVSSLTPILIILAVLGVFYLLSRRARTARAKSLIHVNMP